MLVCRRVISSTSVSVGLSDDPSDEDFTPSSAAGDFGSRHSKRLLSAIPGGSTKRVRTNELSSDDSPGLGFSGVICGDDEGR